MMFTPYKTIIFCTVFLYTFFTIERAYSCVAEPKKSALVQAKPESRTDVDRLTSEAEELVNRGEMALARKKIKEAERLSEVVRYDPGLAKSKSLFGKLLLAQGKYDSATVLLEDAYARFQHLDQGLSIGNSLATSFRYRTEYSKAMNLYLQLLNRAVEEEDEFFQSAIHQNLAVIYENLSDRSQALEHYHKSLKFAEARADTSTLAILLNNIADLYRVQGDYEEAEKFMSEALTNARLDQSPRALINYYLNYGVLKRSQKQYDKAIENYDKALELANEIGDIYTPVQILFNKGNIYLDQDMPDEAERSFQKSLELSRDQNILIGEVYNGIGLGDVEVKRDNFESSIDYFESALKIAEETNSITLQQPILERLSESNKKAGRFQEAYRYLSDYSTMTDSLNKLDQEKEKARFETLLGLRNERQENTLLQEKLSAQKSAIIIGSISLVLIALSAISLFFMYKKQKHYVTELKSKHIELNHLYKQMESQKVELADVNQTKDKLFSILAHDLRSPISKLYSLMMILREGMTDEINIDEALDQLDLQLNNSIITLENYLNWAQSQMKGLSADLHQVSLFEEAEKVCQDLKHSAEIKSISLINNIDNTLIAMADSNLVHVIFRNLMSNAIKFSNSGESVTMDASVTENKIRVSVKDTGVGIPKEKQGNIFKAFHESKQGTHKETGTGLGLAICKEFAEIQNGKIRVESILEKGSTFYLELEEAKEIVTS